MHRFPHLCLTLVLATACGGVNSPEDGDAAVEDDDTTPPVITSISPEDGATQVMDQPIIIAFNEPMDEASVAAAFPDAGLTWSNDDMQVEITEDLPFAETAETFTVTVPTTVTDVAGNGLAEETSVSFTLAELHQATIDFDAALSGNVGFTCGAGTFVVSGDKPNNDPDCPGAVTFGGISFPLATLPDRGEVLAVRSAFVRSEVIHFQGDPNAASLGGIVVDQVVIAARTELTDPTFKAEAARMWFQPGDLVIGDAVELEVGDLVDSSWSDGDASFQLRFRPAAGSNGDAVQDMAFLRRAADENDSLVDAGLAEPDAANRMRLEIEYFM